MSNGKFLYHTSCPSCGSRDNLAVYDNDTSFCFGCRTYYSQHSSGSQSNDIRSTPREHRTLAKELFKGRTVALDDRGISQQTCRHYGVTVGVKDKKPAAHFYPYFEDGVHVGNKVRYLAEKDFRVKGRLSGLFGQQTFPKGCAKYITLTEGELDALSVYQLQGSKFPAVSVPNGAQAAVKAVKTNLEYLEAFERVYICFDNDEPGIKAAKAVAPILSPGKAYIVHLEEGFKDPNDYLVANKVERFNNLWWKAELFTPEGIVSSSALKDRIRNRTKEPSVPYPWVGLNAKTYGIRKGEMVIVTAQTGVGKTALLREIEYQILQEDPETKVGTLFLEETVEDSGLGLMSIEANKPLHLPDCKYTEEEYNSAERILDNNRVYFYNSFGSTSIDAIISRVRYYAKGLDCKYIILDHLSIIVSDQSHGDERKALDEIVTKLKTLTIELGIALIAVVHLNREGNIRSTAAIEQLANIVIRLERDVKDEDEVVRNTTQVIVEKNRYAGKTGPATQLYYDENTGRLDEL